MGEFRPKKLVSLSPVRKSSVRRRDVSKGVGFQKERGNLHSFFFSEKLKSENSFTEGFVVEERERERRIDVYYLESGVIQRDLLKSVDFE